MCVCGVGECVGVCVWCVWVCVCVGGLPLVMDVSYCNTYYEDSDSLTFPGNVSSSSFTLALRISPISSPAQVKEIVM